MEITLRLALPRDKLSVPVVRRVLTGSLMTLGIERGCIGELELALAEACSNVLHHATSEEEYEVSVDIAGSTCLIEVADRGTGFDATHHGHQDAHESAETGRGIQLMRALVDRVSFEQHDDDGTVVRLEKELAWREGAVLSKLETQPR